MINAISKSIAILKRTPATLSSLLKDQDAFWTHSNYGENTFSPFDVVGHLIHADRTNWIQRVKTIIKSRNTQPLPTFDRYQMYEDNKEKSMNDLLSEFSETRDQSINSLLELNLGEEELNYPGLHPQAGAVTLGELIAAWVVHDLGHLHQIAKAMAYQYRNDVGPWKEYLTILPRGKSN